MYPLFETICVKDGVCQNMEYHINRFQRASNAYFGHKPAYDIDAMLSIPKEHQNGIIKLKILYNQTGQKFLFEQYKPKKIESLQLVSDDAITYNLKYTNRTRLNFLFQQKKDCDDILILKNGLVTDTSFCNIAFFDGSKWLTPSKPLLRGTMRQKLLDEKTIYEDDISGKDLHDFTHFKLINAMKEFTTGEPSKINCINS